MSCLLLSVDHHIQSTRTDTPLHEHNSPLSRCDITPPYSAGFYERYMMNAVVEYDDLLSLPCMSDAVDAKQCVTQSIIDDQSYYSSIRKSHRAGQLSINHLLLGINSFYYDFFSLLYSYFGLLIVLRSCTE